MFSLIVIIVAIALALGLMIFTMYHGGSETFQEGHREARAAQAVNELQQIKAAQVAYKLDKGTDAGTLTDLVPSYLATVPDGWGLDVPSLVAFDAQQLTSGTDNNLIICKQVNAKLGMDPAADPPACDSLSPDFTGCCAAP